LEYSGATTIAMDSPQHEVVESNDTYFMRGLAMESVLGRPIKKQILWVNTDLLFFLLFLIFVQ
jgi:hypothetical protein